MIQRIQTIYLICFIIVIALFISFDCNISGGLGIRNDLSRHIFLISSQKTVFLFEKSIGKNNISYNWSIIISQMVCAILAFIAIFSFRNLKLQKKLLSFNYLLTGASCIFIFSTHYNVVNSFKNVTELHYSICLFLPLSLFLFNFLSIRGIRRDIEVLESADRLR